MTPMQAIGLSESSKHQGLVNRVALSSSPSTRETPSPLLLLQFQPLVVKFDQSRSLGCDTELNMLGDVYGLPILT